MAALPAPVRRLVFVAFALVIATRVALWILPSRVIIRIARGIPAPDRVSYAGRIGARRIAWAVENVSRYVPRATCLTQALAGQMLLARHGHLARLCLGVARDESGRFRAHAWLESDGRIVIGAAGVSELTRLPDLSTASRESNATGRLGGDRTAAAVSAVPRAGGFPGP
jgi:hypothetical protein